MTRSAPPPRSKRPWLIGLLVVLLVGAALFAVGYYLGRQPIPALRSELATVRAQLQGAQLRAALQSARAALYQGAADLDRRNFGIANTRIDEAAQDLARAAAYADGEFATELSELQQLAEGTDLNVAANLQEQREVLLGLAGNVTRAVTQLPAR